MSSLRYLADIDVSYRMVLVNKKDAKQFKTVFASLIVAEAGLEHATSRL